MSKIITKKQLDLVVESTLIEAGLVKEETTTIETDIVTESVNTLVAEVNKTTLNEEMSNELDNFKRFINFEY